MEGKPLGGSATDPRQLRELGNEFLNGRAELGESLAAAF
jgi:hypothetical protein